MSTMPPLPTPPHSREAEKALLGGILRDPDILPDIEARLSPESFYFDAHVKLFAAIIAVRDRGIEIDMPTVFAEVKQRGHLEDIGGVQYLTEVWESSATGANAVYHAKLIAEKAVMRRVIHAANVILRDAYNPAADGKAFAEEAERVMCEATASLTAVGSGPVVARQFIPEALRRIDERVANGGRGDWLATGYIDIDEIFGSLVPGSVTTVAARPSRGKTAFGLNLAMNVAQRGEPVLFFTLEMPVSQIADRLLSMGSGVPMSRFTRGERMSDLDYNRIAAAGSFEGVCGCPILVDDTSAPTVSYIMATARRAIQRYGVRLVVVDYLQLIRPENPSENRTQQVGQISRRVKHMARTLGVPVVSLCQLNRQSENREGKRPQLSDLRDSGEIEQDSDSVILLHPHPVEGHEIWQTDVLIEKQRNGPTGTVSLAYRRPVMRFENAAPQ